MNQANKAKINMAAIHRRMSGRHSRQQSINSLVMFQRQTPHSSICVKLSKAKFKWYSPTAA
jgi:hypothetical protein